VKHPEVKDLLEKVRGWLIEEKIGLISKAELVRRADELIDELDNPPDYLISVSFGENLEHVPRLDLIRERVTDADCPEMARKILQRYAIGAIGLEDVGIYALNMANMLGAGEGPYVDFDWINDEVYLVSTGIKERASSEKMIIEVLERLSAC
jgi:hypothetical protein